MGGLVSTRVTPFCDTSSPSAAQEKRGEEVVDEDRYVDPDDESNLFAGTVYEADDADADAVWESVEERMDGRRRARREAAEAAELARERILNPKLDTKFADLKRGLSSVTDTEWENIPEVGDLTRKRRKANLRLDDYRAGRTYAQSDSVLAGAFAQNQLATELDPTQPENGGTETPAIQGTETDLVGIGQARDRVLSLSLDRVSDVEYGLQGVMRG